MPWKERSRVDERLALILSIIEGTNVAAACRTFGVSRQTAYKWLRRYEEGGEAAVSDRSRAPNAHPNETPEDIAELVLKARVAHPTWGPRKLLAWLEPRHPKKTFPAASTVAAMLKRAGLVAARRRRQRANPTGRPPNAPGGPNYIWGTDFKGQFKTGDGVYCYPLTMQDCCSRYLLRCQGLRENSCELARPVFETAFREYGLPNAILSDNGSPFGSASFTGLTDLSAWWVRLGIEVLRIEPGHPEQNGRLERLHGTLKSETTKPAKANLSAQQRVFNRFRAEFNDERPHEAIANETPGSAYTPSNKAYPDRVPKPEYPGTFEVRRLNRHGEVHFEAYRFTIGKALRHEDIGFEPIDDGIWRLHYYAQQLGTFSESTGILARPGFANKASSTRTRQRNRSAS